MAVVSMIVLWGWLEDDQLVTSNIVRIIAQRSFMQFLSSDQFGMFAKQDFRELVLEVDPSLPDLHAVPLPEEAVI